MELIAFAPMLRGTVNVLCLVDSRREVLTARSPRCTYMYKVLGEMPSYCLGKAVWDTA